jgi:hypothetical protein
LAEAVNVLQNGSGKRIIDDFQTVVGYLRDEEMRLLMLRDEDAKRRLGQTKIALIF